jgi:hypothetical protein
MSAAVSPPLPLPAPQTGALRRALSALAIEPLHLVSLLLCCVAFAGWFVTVCKALPPLAVVFFVLLALSAYYLGRVVLRWVPLADELSRSFAMIFLTGCLTWALAMLGLHSLLPGSLRWHTAGLFVLSAGGQLVIHRREPPAREERGAALLGVFVVFFCLAAATCWARGLFQPTRDVDGQVEFRHWLDYFDHTAFTSQFLGRDHLWRAGNKELSHTPAPLYHYGSYLFPAALASFSRLDVYDVVVAFWTPLATFLLGLAACALVTAFAGRAAGAWAPLALLALPDASYYWFKNAWFRVHWLFQIHANAMCGLACAALALLFLLEARRSRSRAALALAAAFGAATFFFKAQFFVVLVPLLIAWFVLCYPRCSVAWRILLLGGVVVVTLGGILASNELHLGPRIEPSREYFEWYCRFVAAENEPGQLRTVVENGAAAAGRSRYYLAGTALVMLSSFGALLAAVPLLGVWAWWKKKMHAADLAPWLALFLYGAFLVGLDDSVVGVNRGEIIHRPVMWAYFVVLVWCAGKLCVLVRDTRLGNWAANPKVIGAAGLILLALPWHMGRNVQEGKMAWRSACSNRRFPRGLVECGRYVARTGSRADLVQDSQYDACLVFGSLSERRSYLARPATWSRSKDPAVPAEIERRQALIEHFKAATTAEEIQQVAAQTGIRWFLVHPDDRVPWPRNVLDHPAFAADSFALYDLSQVSASRGVAAR